MPHPILSAADSVPADVSEFHRAELDAFVAIQLERNGDAWARVQGLQAVCIYQKPVSPAGAEEALRVLAQLW